MATNSRPIVVDEQLAAAERTAAQQIPLHVSSAVNGLSSLVAQLRPASTPPSKLSPSTAAILSEIFQAALRAMESSQSAEAEKAAEAQKKAQTWSLIGLIVTLIVVIVIAIVVTVFTFGAAAPAMAVMVAGLVAAMTAICDAMVVALLRGHPLASRFSAVVSQVSATLQAFTQAKRYDPVSVDAALRQMLQALRTIEGLGREASQIVGPCTGDPNAIYVCGQQLAPLLVRLSDILRTMRLLADDQTQAAIRALQTATVVLTKPRLPK